MNMFIGDLLLGRGGNVPSAAIREGTQEPGEAPTVYNHTGVIVRPGNVYKAQVVEALPQGVVRRGVSAYLKPGADSVIIYRHIGLTNDQRAAVAHVAERYVGTHYGWGMVLADAGDWLIGSKWFFRGMIRPGTQIVCSSVAARAYQTVGYTFRALPSIDAVTPDDIGDNVAERCEIWYPVMTI